MSLDLDRRQRAMLQEMGLRVWSPEVGGQTAQQLQTPTQAAPKSQAAPAVAAEARVRPAPSSERHRGDLASLGVLPDNIATMDWPALGQSIATCQACQLCDGRRTAVFGAAHASRRADWLVVGEPPDEAEESDGTPFVAQAGQLLDNMLKAVGVSRRSANGSAWTVAEAGRAAYVTNVVKCRPAVRRNPDQAELARCENYLSREIALVQPKIILALGRFAAQALLQGNQPEICKLPLGKLRGHIHHHQGIPVVVSYHPAYLLRTPQDKARAWDDLCLALAQLRCEP